MATHDAAAATTSGRHVAVHGLQGVVLRTGTPAYSNGSDDHFTHQLSKSGHFCTGFRWQCVEFARRWLWDAKGLILPSIGFASHIFFQPEVYDPSLKCFVPVRAVRNGSSSSPPEADSLIIYPSSLENFVGHVGVIVESSETFVRVADQNRYFHHWEGAGFSREYPVERDAQGRYWIRDHEAHPLGWVTFPRATRVLPQAEQRVHAATFPDQVETLTDGDAFHITRQPFPTELSSPPELPTRTHFWLAAKGFANFHPSSWWVTWAVARFFVHILKMVFRTKGKFVKMETTNMTEHNDATSSTKKRQ